MSSDYRFLNNIDSKILVAMIILSSALTLGAIVLNLTYHGQKDCLVSEYVYCGEAEAASDH